MIRIKKGFTMALVSGVLVTGNLGAQTLQFVLPAVASAAATDDGLSSDGGGSSGVPGSNQADFSKMPEQVTLTIHKYSNEEDNSGLVNDGTDQGEPYGEPVKNVTFTVQRIGGIELATNEGWQDAEKLSKEFKTKGEAALTGKHAVTGNAVDLVTDDEGLASKKFPRGLYLVKETAVPADSEYRLSVKPFIVALPMTNPYTLTTWLDNVHVFPKNQRKEIPATKTVKDASAATPVLLAGTENKIEYTIKQELTVGYLYNGMILSDFYPADRLVLEQEAPGVLKNPPSGVLKDPTDVVVKIGYKENAQDKEEFLDSNTDYDIDLNVDGRVIIMLNQSGLTKVNAKRAAEDAHVSAVLKFKVNENATDGEAKPIVNKFKTWTSREDDPPQPDESTPPGTPPNPPSNTPVPPEDAITPPPVDEKNPPAYPKSYYGNVDIRKKSTDGKDLTGAKFDLYKCESADALTVALKGNEKPTPLKSGIVADGSVEIKGLLATNYQDGIARLSSSYHKYCLVETQAPENYELLAEPIDFEVLAKADASIALTPVEVVDVKANGGFTLPLTGGKGVFALLLAGATFLVLGRGYSVFGGRRKKA